MIARRFLMMARNARNACNENENKLKQMYKDNIKYNQANEANLTNHTNRTNQTNIHQDIQQHEYNNFETLIYTVISIPIVFIAANNFINYKYNDKNNDYEYYYGQDKNDENIVGPNKQKKYDPNTNYK